MFWQYVSLTFSFKKYNNLNFINNVKSNTNFFNTFIRLLFFSKENQDSYY